jgi:hypothetical protein
MIKNVKKKTSKNVFPKYYYYFIALNKLIIDKLKFYQLKIN